MTKAILPGALLGIIGCGPHGRMLALAARRMGYRVAALGPEAGGPAAEFAHLAIRAPLDDVDAVADLARNVAAVVVAVDRLPAQAAETIARRAPLRPGLLALQVAEHRGREKDYLRQHGFPVTSFAEVGSLETLSDALDRLGVPAMLKAARPGSAGRSHSAICSPLQAREAWAELGMQPCILEEWIDIHRKLMVIVAQSPGGGVATYGPIQYACRFGILDASASPVSLPKGAAERAVQLARDIASRLEVVGLICVELFLTDDSELLVNQLIPRPHDSGHLTSNAHATSQYEQLVRAMCGLPLGPAEQLRPAAAASLDGNLWRNGEPDWAMAFQIPETYLHLYGNREPRPGRRMGHVTALAGDSTHALSRALIAREAMQRRPIVGLHGARARERGAVQGDELGSATAV